MGSSTSSLSQRILLTSAGVVSVAMATRFFLPSMLDFAVNDIPVIWSVILSWLRPPYLYIVINGIIITIAASSRFHHHYNHYQSENHSQPLVDETNSISPLDLPSELPPMSIQPSFDGLERPSVVYESEDTTTEEAPAVYETEPPVIDVETVPVNDSDVVPIDADDKFVISRSMWYPPHRIINSPPPENIPSEFISPLREMPLVSSRFAHQRRTTRINPEGVRSLRVAKPRKHETLESTWKAITDGRHIPLNRHLRKSDIFESHHHQPPPSDAYPSEDGSTSAAADNYMMNKLETFNDRTDYGNRNDRVLSSKNSMPSPGGKLRKEGSLGQDELNRRVEAFIKKFNEEMRLQRQESLKRYMDMVNRGT